MEGMGHPHRKEIDFNKNPFIVIWEVTRACELKCVHCRADAQVNPDPRELTYQEGLKLIDEIYEMDNPMLVFTGGDCMLREDLFDLADYAVKKGMRVSMTPSATAPARPSGASAPSTSRPDAVPTGRPPSGPTTGLSPVTWCPARRGPTCLTPHGCTSARRNSRPARRSPRRPSWPSPCSVKPTPIPWCRFSLFSTGRTRIRR